MKKIIYTLFIFAFIFKANSQTSSKPWTFFIDKVDSVCSNVTADFPVRVKNFRNVVAFQGSINWDTAIVKFDTVSVNPNIPHFKPIDFFSNLQKTDGYIAFLWTDADTTANSFVTVPDSTTLFTLRLKINNPVNNISPIYFSNTPTPMQIDTATDMAALSDLGTPTDTLWKNGSITFIDTPKVVQNQNVFTCMASCMPVMYIWETLDCNGILISTDTTYTNVFVSPLPDSTCYSVACAARYGNGMVIKSATTPNALPVRLVSFSAKLQNSRVLLSWQTSNEVNMSHFNVQRSLNNKEFVTIGKVNAGKSEYWFSNENVSVTAKDKLYYRLQIVDKDGGRTYSKIEQITISSQAPNSISIYPNPSKGNITIECSNTKELLIIDCMGRQVKKQSFTATSNIVQYQLNKGLYIARILLNNGEIKTEKLIVE